MTRLRDELADPFAVVAYAIWIMLVADGGDTGVAVADGREVRPFNGLVGCGLSFGPP